MSKAKIRNRRRDERTPLQRARDDRQEANRIAWLERHPEAAAAERAIRKELALHERWSHKNEGTPQTHERASRRHQGSLARLCKAGVIDADQLAWAAEIAAIAERIGADVQVKTASLEARVDVTRMGDGSFYERLGQVRREVAYTRWRRALQTAGHPVAAVLDMVVGDTIGFTVVAARYGMHHRRARRLLLQALDLWPTMLGAACKDVDQDALTRAHARLAA